MAEVRNKALTIENPLYRELVEALIDRFPYWDQLNGKQVLISGASGMLGSLLIDAVMVRNSRMEKEERCKIIAVSRDPRTAEQRFGAWINVEEFRYISHDMREPIDFLEKLPQFYIHAASTTHPVQYVNEPINTILANILGTRNLLDLSARTRRSRFLLLSSVEIYGENRGDAERFDEGYCGYMDCNTLRAGYPEAKRVSEAMCQAYLREKEVDPVILRLPRCYGPTMRMSDTKAIAQFIKKGLAGEDIVLKSRGEQLYSYAFAADAVLGMLWVLLRGEKGNAYNLADPDSDIQLKDLAAAIAALAGVQVRYELPNQREQAGYSTATKALLDAEKLRKLGWRAYYDLNAGLSATMNILSHPTSQDV